MHARQLALQQRGIGVQQALDAAGAFGAGDRADTGTLAHQVVLGDAALHQQQVAAVLAQREGALGGVVEQQVALAETREVVAQGQAQLQLQGDAAVGDLDLQGMAQGTHQLATADGMGQVVLAAVLAVEEHQAAAVVEGQQLAVVEAGSLVQAVAITLQQVHQASPWQAAQLVLGAQLDGQHGAALRLRRGGRRWSRARFGHFFAQVGEGVLLIRGEQLA
ncbi:hypothetical protein D3C85_1035430 [compost metagenome]